MKKTSIHFIIFGFVNAILLYLGYQQLIKLSIAPQWFIFCVLTIVIIDCIISYKMRKNNFDLQTYSIWISVLLGTLIGSICTIIILLVLAFVISGEGVYPYGGGMGIPYHICSTDVGYLFNVLVYTLMCTEIGIKLFEYKKNHIQK